MYIVHCPMASNIISYSTPKPATQTWVETKLRLSISIIAYQMSRAKLAHQLIVVRLNSKRGERHSEHGFNASGPLWGSSWGHRTAYSKWILVWYWFIWLASFDCCLDNHQPPTTPLKTEREQRAKSNVTGMDHHKLTASAILNMSLYEKLYVCGWWMPRQKYTISVLVQRFASESLVW